MLTAIGTLSINTACRSTLQIVSTDLTRLVARQEPRSGTPNDHGSGFERRPWAAAQGAAVISSFSTAEDPYLAKSER
ncbi:hypothetical protein NXC14_PC00220 (plasmid) [Rhizobium sp. NXC14]|nr:hypothetical protein NXC14_PC00220 [Rhizobium sp. NXC14]